MVKRYAGLHCNDAEVRIKNLAITVRILSATDSDSQRWLSGLAGKYDKTMKSTSKNQRDLDPFGGSGTSYSEQLRDIIPPETFGELPNTGQLILFNPHNRFCRVNKVPWYNDPTWDKDQTQEGA